MKIALHSNVELAIFRGQTRRDYRVSIITEVLWVILIFSKKSPMSDYSIDPSLLQAQTEKTWNHGLSDFFFAMDMTQFLSSSSSFQIYFEKGIGVYFNKNRKRNKRANELEKPMRTFYLDDTLRTSIDLRLS